MTRLTLPWPPSVNRYYRNVSGVTKISAEGRAYRAAVVNLLAEKSAKWGRAYAVGMMTVEDRARMLQAAKEALGG